MSFWTAAVVIVGIIAMVEIIKSRHRSQAGITTDMMGNEKLVKSENTELKREIEQLHERIKVLERIATEERETKLLSAEIESLRDK